MKNTRIEINVKGDESREISLFLPWDANLEDWRNAFRVILKWQTFHDDSIKEILPDEEY